MRGDSITLKAPFPWFGGKSKCAHIVWDYFHDVDNYVEPFAGSMAALLNRPEGWKGVETVNDLDCYIANFWRAVKHDPVAVAQYANNPVNEADLTARHLWLVNTGKERVNKLFGDPDYYDAKVAGWWVWGICCWIGAGWCSGQGPWRADEDGQLVHLGNAGQGVNRKLVHLGDAGQGVNRKIVHLGDAGQGVNRKLVHLGDAGRGVNRKRIHLGNVGQGVNRRLIHLGNAGQGVNRKLIHLGNAGQGVNRKLIHLGDAGQGVDTGEDCLIEYMTALAERLRYVRVCCGDWQRVVTGGALNSGNVKGIFLDPPYDQSIRDDRCYNTDSEGLSAQAYDWAIEHQDWPDYRIILCGYEGEHDIPKRWKTIEWTANRAYGRMNTVTANSENRRKERLWVSPQCTERSESSHKPLSQFGVTA